MAILNTKQNKLAKNRKRLEGHSILDISFKTNWIKCLCKFETTISEYSNHRRNMQGLPPFKARIAPEGLSWGLTGLVLKDYDYE